MEKFTGKYKSDDELPIIKRKQKTRKLCTSRMSWIIYHDNDTRADKFAVSSILSIFLFGFLQSTQSFELTQFLGHAVKRNGKHYFKFKLIFQIFKKKKNDNADFIFFIFVRIICYKFILKHSSYVEQAPKEFFVFKPFA